MRKTIHVFMIMFFILSVAACTTPIVMDVDLEQESVVFGRFDGYVLAKKGELFVAWSYESEEMRIENLELMNQETGQVYKLGLTRDGYFTVPVVPGDYILQQNRKGSEDYELEKTQEHDSFKVPAGSLVNTGTYRIKVEKKIGTIVSGITVVWSMKHDDSLESAEDPKGWFAGKYPDFYLLHKDKVVNTFDVDSAGGKGSDI